MVTNQKHDKTHDYRLKERKKQRAIEVTLVMMHLLIRFDIQLKTSIYIIF
jgi:hypothetical protein